MLICEYCNEKKHPDRCPQEQDDRVHYAESVHEWRTIILARLHEHGLGAGAIVTDESSRYLIKKVHWSEIIPKMLDQGKEFKLEDVTVKFSIQLVFPENDDRLIMDSSIFVPGEGNVLVPAKAKAPDDWFSNMPVSPFVSHKSTMWYLKHLTSFMLMLQSEPGPI